MCKGKKTLWNIIQYWYFMLGCDLRLFHSILQYNISLHHDIYCDSGLPYYTCLFTLTNYNFILFSLKCNDDVLFFSYNHFH